MHGNIRTGKPALRPFRLPRQRRAVIGPDGKIHESCTDAAIAANTSVSTISTRCTLEQKGWRYATPDEQAAAGFEPYRPTLRR